MKHTGKNDIIEIGHSLVNFTMLKEWLDRTQRVVSVFVMVHVVLYMFLVSKNHVSFSS